jgi:hypothetical protein
MYPPNSPTQTTPSLQTGPADVLLAKALELFMDRIIKAVADETKSRGARKVTPSHLSPPIVVSLINSKQIICARKEFDFLEGLATEIPFPPSAPSTPPATTTAETKSEGTTRRRRRNDGEQGTIVKRKRRTKEKAQEPEAKPEKMEEVKMEEMKMEEGKQEPRDVDVEDVPRRGRGWFDIVMGSTESHSSSDDDARQ